MFQNSRKIRKDNFFSQARTRGFNILLIFKVPLTTEDDDFNEEDADEQAANDDAAKM
jgi:hypothetical protein